MIILTRIYTTMPTEFEICDSAEMNVDISSHRLQII